MDNRLALIIEEIKTSPEINFSPKQVERLLIVVFNCFDVPVTNLSMIFDFSPETVAKWLSRFDEKGIAGLEDLGRSGRPKILTPQEEAQIKESILNKVDNIFEVEDRLSAKIMIDEIKKDFNKEYSQSSIYRILHELALSFQKARPVHEKNDTTVMTKWIEELPKKIESITQDIPDKEIEFYLQDETRFGQQTISTRVWSNVNSDLRYINQNGFLNSWIFGAVNPINGAKFGLILPRLDSINMQIFLDEFSKTITSGKVVVMILDGSKAHNNNIIKIPENIRFCFLPPYSPELNPIERLWLHIKNKYLAFKRYSNYEEIIKAGADSWNKISAEIVKSICKCKYLSGFNILKTHTPQRNI